MARWVTTSWYRWTFKLEHTVNKSENRRWNKGVWERNYWNVSGDSISEALNSLSKYCNENQYELKAIMPIDKARSYEYGQVETHQWTGASAGFGWGWGLGQGWATSMPDGFMAVLQRIEDISQEEFDRRFAEVKQKAESERVLDEKKKQLENSISEIKKLLENITTELNSSRKKFDDNNAYASAEIQQKSGLFSKIIVIDKSFKKIEEASAFQQECKASATGMENTIQALTTQLEETQLKLKKLESELQEI